MRQPKSLTPDGVEAVLEGLRELLARFDGNASAMQRRYPRLKQQTVSHYIRGTKVPGRAFADALSEALGRDVLGGGAAPLGSRDDWQVARDAALDAYEGALTAEMLDRVGRCAWPEPPAVLSPGYLYDAAMILQRWSPRSARAASRAPPAESQPKHDAPPSSSGRAESHGGGSEAGEHGR